MTGSQAPVQRRERFGSYLRQQVVIRNRILHQMARRWLSNCPPPTHKIARCDTARILVADDNNCWHASFLPAAVGIALSMALLDGYLTTKEILKLVTDGRIESGPAIVALTVNA